MEIDGNAGEDGRVKGMTHMDFWVFRQERVYICELQNISYRLSGSQGIGEM
jgi:hypothetical protein